MSNLKIRIRQFLRNMAWSLVHFYRRLLVRTVFIGVTGSSGKTTTKELIYAILSRRYRGAKTPHTMNGISAMCHAVIRTMPWHRFCVLEMASGVVGAVKAGVTLIPLDIGVVLTIKLEHFTAFRSLELIAADKENVVTQLKPEGLAILNSDDPLVDDMARRTSASIIRFGFSPRANVQCTQASSVWPDRLRLDVRLNGSNYQVNTQLCGLHWAGNILAALAVGLQMKIPVDEMLEVIRCFQPVPGRMCPVTLADGVTFIRDDWKAPVSGMHDALDFMKQARAERKWIVVGTLSDYPGSASPKYRRVAAEALESADMVMFIGVNARYAVKGGTINPNPNLFLCESLNEADDILNEQLKSGDLVLLKGSGTTDELRQLVFMREQRLANRNGTKICLRNQKKEPRAASSWRAVFLRVFGRSRGYK